MFKISVEELKHEVGKIVSAAKRSRLVSAPIFVSGSKESKTVSFSFVGEILSVKKTFNIDVEEDLSFATSVTELQLKVSSLPDDVEVTITKSKSPSSNMYLKWGRNNGIVLFTEKEPKNEMVVPEVGKSISLPPGKWEYISRTFTPFSSLPKSKPAEKHPTTKGVFISKDESGVLIQASNSVRAIRDLEEMDWFDSNISIPSEAINSVAEIISSKDILSLSLSISGTLLVVESESVIAVVRILDGDFPEIDHLFTDENARVVWRADRLELLETTRRIKRLGEDKPTIHILKRESKHFAILKGILTEQIGACLDSEDEDGFYVSAGNLEAALTVLRSEEVLITFENEKTLTLLSPNDEENEKQEYMKIMLTQMKGN